MRTVVAAMVILGCFGIAIGSFAQMSSADYQIRWDTVGNGGDDISSSASYILRDTVGAATSGESDSASYVLQAGYRQGVYDQVIDFSFFVQNASVSQEATSLVGNTITCDPSGLSVGDMVALIQDEGAGQVSAVGKISSVGIGSIVVDALKDGGSVPSIDGDNDFVYLLDGSVMAFGTLTTTSVRTSIIGMEVTADVPGGYTVQILSDGNLRSGSDTINSVSDGDVTTGSEEYGARSSDTTLFASDFYTEDTGFTTSFQTIADTGSAVFNDRNFLVAKSAISSGTASGSYAQTLTLIVSGNF